MRPATGSRVAVAEAHAPTARTAALAGLAPLQVADLPRWKSALERAQSSGYGCYFPYLLAHQRPERTTMLVAEDAGSLCLFIRHDRTGIPRLDLFLPPVPMDVSVAVRCLERANDFNGDHSARILRIDTNDAPLVASIPGVIVRERRWQYLYAPQAFGDLAGGKYKTVRYHVTRVRRLEGLEVIPYSGEYAGACRALLDHWSDRHRSTFGTSGDAGLSKRALTLTRTLAAPDLFGELVLLGGRVVAFAFGGEIRPGLGCLLEAKTDPAVSGLTHFQCYSFISKMDSCELINGGSDARRAGIGELKESLRPAAIHVEYGARQVTI